MSAEAPKWLYAIGDIHGCYDKLTVLLARIAAHADGAPYQCVFLGDYVDRGAQSREVVDLIMRLCTKASAAGRYGAIRGNHEHLMLKACDTFDGADMVDWLDNGGSATLASYKGYESDMRVHLDWLGALPAFHETDHYFFVHAGVSRRHPLHEQPEEVMLWTRNWERHDHDFGKHVVYGHNPADEPRLMRYSTGLDTGAVYGGPLSAGVFDPLTPGGPQLVLRAD